MACVDFGDTVLYDGFGRWPTASTSTPRCLHSAACVYVTGPDSLTDERA